MSNRARNLADPDVKRELTRTLRQATKTGMGMQVVKRMTYNTACTTAAGGALAFTLDSSAVNASATEWSSYSARYLDYRVLRMVVTFVPYYVSNGAVGTAYEKFTGVLVAYDPSATFSIASIAAVWALEKCQIKPITKQWSATFQATEREHMLYNPTNAVIPAANRFRAVFATPGSILTGPATYGTFYVEWIVEFRGAQ